MVDEKIILLRNAIGCIGNCFPDRGYAFIEMAGANQKKHVFYLRAENAKGERLPARGTVVRFSVYKNPNRGGNDCAFDVEPIRPEDEEAA